ncbi:MAG TPA: DUF488 domain-containing protein [Candidatus Dormibacteraeota bacterium]|nr:DUF488 domain-containing protein [Candidatus Dormibacteraeota bacterium]
MARAIFSVGHSNTSLEDFLARLAQQAIAGLADVRAYPASRRHPHFGREALAAACTARGIDYRWLPGLGGRRKGVADSPHLAWREPGFRAYADYMDTPEFLAARAELEAMARGVRTAFLCAEALWWQCHRRLIADSLLVAGWDVRHIASDGSVQPHALPEFARVIGERIVYDRGITPPLSSRL